MFPSFKGNSIDRDGHRERIKDFQMDINQESGQTNNCVHCVHKYYIQLVLHCLSQLLKDDVN